MHFMSVGWQVVELMLDNADVPCVSVSEPFEEDGGVLHPTYSTVKDVQ